MKTVLAYDLGASSGRLVAQTSMGKRSKRPRKFIVPKQTHL